MNALVREKTTHVQGEVHSLRIYAHTAGEVWGLTAYPKDRSLFASVHTKVDFAFL